MKNILAKIGLFLAWLLLMTCAILLVVTVLYCPRLRTPNKAVDAAKQKVAITQHTLQAQVDTNAEIEKQVAQKTAAYSKLFADTMAQNKTLLATIARQKSETKKQQVVDQTLPLPDLAHRWEELANLPSGQISATLAGLEILDTGARETVKLLETIPSLKAEVKSYQDISASDVGLVRILGSEVSDLRTQVDGLKTEIVDQKAACAAQANLVQVKIKKRGLCKSILIAIASKLFL